MKDFIHSRFFLLIIIAFLVKFCVFAIALNYDIGSFNANDQELFNDYKTYYIPQTEDFLNGKLPYWDFWFAYPPLFLYTLAIFSSLSSASWRAAVPLIIFDALTVLMVFIISRKFLSLNKSFYISLIYAFSPLNLLYNDILWLNPPPMTFFILVSTYFTMEKKIIPASLALAVATCFKSMAIFLFPVTLVAVYRALGSKQALNFLLFYVIPSTFFSLPYLLMFPGLYIWSVGLNIGPPNPIPPWYGGIQQTSVAESATSTNIALSPVNLASPILFYGGQTGFHLALYNFLQLLLVVLLLSFYLILLFYVKKTDEKNLLEYSILALLISHVFFPRGIYKYYFTLFTPFLALYIEDWKAAVVFIVFNFVVLGVPRVFTSYLLLAVILWLMIQKVLIKKNAKALKMPMKPHNQ
jgi:hypothetical protein